ncbi:MAG: MtnX-like HAD-IB family phosphatase [Pseudomonadota bacterium]
MHVFCDFDGTITREDATDFILSRLADPRWEAIEQEWKLGHIGSAECMRRQIPLITASKETLDATLDAVEIDADFYDFVRFCEAQSIRVSILSDGVDYFIRRILSRIGLQHLPIIANRFTITETGYELDSPYAIESCASAAGVCKCKVVDKGREPRMYVGDGQSDFCVSDKPELVFAKGKLASFCARNATPFVAYEDFSDVTQALQRLLPGVDTHEPIHAFA